MLVSVISTSSVADDWPKTIPDAEEASLHGALHQIRYIKAGDADVTTSKCIGNPVTPLCAAETWFADSVYEGDDLTFIARGRKQGGPDFELPLPWSKGTYCYQLNGYWYYHANDIAVTHSRYPVEPGDVALDFMTGRVENGKCNLAYAPGSGRTYGMLVRKGPFGWYLHRYDAREDFVHAPRLDALR